MILRRATTAVACVLAVASFTILSACGDEEPGVDEPAREGLALELGGLEYNVFITRQINADVPPDDAYYSGPDLGADETLYGVFLQVCNHSDEPRPMAEDFIIKDNQGEEFEPEELPEENQFAYRSETLGPDECLPKPGSVAQLGPSAATVLLFKLPLQTTENRPLELEVTDAASEQLTFELDI